ncbi:MAG: DUF6544 family protein [Saprospiraceae bacterium]|nr:DUF6544 family protein [Saprospiraceae bacterium]
MKVMFAGLILLHGVLHLLGFFKAFQMAPIDQLTIPISRPLGMMWLFAALALITSAFLFLFHSARWWIPACLGLLISVYLILNYWVDSKWGMIPNLFLLVALVLHLATYLFKAKYAVDVKQLQNVISIPADHSGHELSLNDLAPVPDLVKNYIVKTGFVGKPIIKNFRAISEGVIRKNENSAWIPLRIEQYNFIEPMTRLFYMNGTMKGLPVTGYHRFKDGHASMDVRLASVVKVHYQDGKEMDIAETVTYFNDLCVFAPGALPFKHVQWEVLDSLAVRAVFTEGNITIRATLYFNDRNELVDFESDDRYFNQEDHTMSKFKWNTPIADYREYHGYYLASKAEAIWHFPQGKLVYARFDLKEIDFNSEYKPIN